MFSGMSPRVDSSLLPLIPFAVDPTADSPFVEASVIAGVSLLIGAGASVVGLLEPVLRAERLALRNIPPSLPEEDFLPSPSVTSASERASVRLSFLPPRVPKND